MTSGWGQLAAPPTDAPWMFPAEEYRRRVAGARTRMGALGLDCLFLTSEKNIRYLTGFHPRLGEMENGKFINALRFLNYTDTVRDVLQHPSTLKASCHCYTV